MQYQDIILLMEVLFKEKFSFLTAIVGLNVLIASTFIALVIKCLFLKPIKKRGKLGECPVNEIPGKKRLLQEIHYAVSRCTGDSEPALAKRCVALLDRFPAAINMPLRRDQYTPFLRACYNGCPQLIAYMLQKGADINSKAAAGDNAFYLATYSILAERCNTFTPLKLLMAAGVDVNGARAGGYTALHLAAARGHDAAVRWLLSRGADPAPRTASLSPRHVALANGHVRTAALLQVRAEGGNTSRGSTDTSIQ